MNVSEQFCRELAHALLDCVGHGRFANSVIQKKFSANRQWSSDERSLFAESLYFMLRNLRRLEYAIESTLSDNLQSSLRIVMAAFQIARVQAPSVILRQARIEASTMTQRWKDADRTRALRYSLPEWLDSLGEKRLGSAWTPFIAATHEEPKVQLRVNRLRCERAHIEQALHAYGLKTQTSELSPDAVILLGFTNVFALKEFKDGLFEVQDSGSQTIAPFVDVQEGMRVIDACAGSGGKSLHLAALMQNKGRILSMDTEEWKLNELQKRSRRDGVSIIETRPISSTKSIKRLHASADRVLLDVPCSGLGVLKRNPDTKWHLQPEDIQRFVTMQRDILSQYCKMMKPAGKLVYATCSILPEECEDQVQWFLSTHPEWVLEEERRVMSHEHQSDSFYMARLRLASKKAGSDISEATSNATSAAS